jgi:hypothetical protein
MKYIIIAFLLDGETLKRRHIGGYPSVEDVLSLFDRTDEEIISYEVHF